MSANNKNSNTDWLNAFLPLGYAHGDSWEPRGGGVLLLDNPMVWLVTARQVVDSLGDEHLTTWVPRANGSGLLNITDSQQRSGTAWVHHPIGLSATLFPLDASFALKAFAETQCTKVRDLQPLQPTASVGCLYGQDIAPTPHPSPAVCDGIISSVDQQSGTIYSTAPLLPHNTGAPLMLASPYGGAVTLAGILLGNAMIAESDPRVLPVRLSRAICIDAAMELIRGKEASEQRQRVSEQVTKEPDQASKGTSSTDQKEQAEAAAPENQAQQEGG